MTDPTRAEFTQLPSSLLRRVDAVCNRFEKAWRAGQRPQIEDYLVAAAHAACQVFLRELLVLEMAYRRRAGERPAPEEYRPRFPEHVSVIEAVFREEPASTRSESPQEESSQGSVETGEGSAAVDESGPPG